MRLAILGVAGTILLMSLAVLFPPWIKVRCQRRQVLWYSEVARVYERRFVGFDWLFAENKWQTTGPPGPRTSGERYDVTEYQIDWPLLAGELIVLGVAAGGLFVVLALRGRGKDSVFPVSRLWIL